jgi:hypothetical protein
MDHHALSCGTASVRVVRARKISGRVECCTFTARRIRALVHGGLFAVSGEQNAVERFGAFPVPLTMRL